MGGPSNKQHMSYNDAMRLTHISARYIGLHRGAGHLTAAASHLLIHKQLS